MKIQTRLSIGFFLGSLWLSGGSSHGWDRYDEQYLELLRVRDCGTSPCALRLKTPNGLWKRPTLESISFVRAHQRQIQAIGREFGVHPTVISAVLVSEASANMDWDDHLQNAVAWSLGDFGEELVFSAGDWVERPISLGRSQVNREGLAHAVAVIRKVSPGRRVTLPQLTRDLLNFHGNPEADLLVIAALAREAQDAYRACGMDISRNVGVLVTLHTLGRPEIRALRALQECRQPSINFLGLFARKYLRPIHEATWRPSSSGIHSRIN